MALTDEQKKTILACEKQVVDALKAHGCHLEGVTVLRPGNVDIQIVVALNPEPAAQAPAEPPKQPQEGFKAD